MIYKNWNTESQTGGIHLIAWLFVCFEGTSVVCCVLCMFAYIKHMLAWLQHNLVERLSYQSRALTPPPAFISLTNAINH